MNPFVFCQSALRIPIFGYEFGNHGPEVLMLGGVHGNEPEGVIAAKGLKAKFLDSFDFSLKITLIPEFNIDGILRKSRLNGNEVDLNRNLPTKDWNPEKLNKKYPPGKKANSESENQALVKLIDQKNFRFIWSLHSWKPLLNVNGNCHPECEVVHQLTHYPIEESIGYPTPGCLGTYAGLERKIPTITYEIENGLTAQKILDIHVPALLKALKETEKRSPRS